MKIGRVWIAALAAVVCGGCLTLTSAHRHPSPENSPATAYFAQFRKQLDLARRDVNHVSAVADSVADAFIKRKAIFSTPNQQSFVGELRGRASGPTAFTECIPERGKPGDVVLLPIDPTPEHPEADARWVNAAHKSPATVIAFASPEDLERVPKDGGSFAPVDFHALIDNHTGTNEFVFARPGQPPRSVRTAGLANILNGWLFMGELTAACTRRGQMPVYWLSFAIDGPRGYPRAAKYSVRIPKGKPWGDQKMFHDDLTVPPIKPGVVANRYLDHLSSYMDRLEGPLWPYMDEIVRRSMAKIEQGHKVFILLIGHAFPRDVPRTEWRDEFVLLGPNWLGGLMGPFEKEAVKGDLFILLCMPTYAREEVKMAQDKGMDVIVMSTERPDVRETNTDSYLWVPAPWPIGDGAVKVKGYDIPLLPVTGIMNGVIYYALRSEVEYRLALKSTKSVTAAK